jgi:endonuclease YncB( thermonuclease family)
MQDIRICLLVLTLYSPALADTIQGKLVKIADGDGGKKHHIRLACIDTPEKD